MASPAWVLVDRAARLVDLHGSGSSDADVVVNLVPPLAISTASVDSALLSRDDDDDTPRCRVEGADASGTLLLAISSPRAPGEYHHLLVCSPVARRSTCTAEGKARALPAFPEALGVTISPTAPTGIVASKGRDGFVVAQLQKPTSPATTYVALALCFSSHDKAWTVKHVPGEDRWRDFAPTRVVSHDRGVASDGVRLVFLDSRRGILLLNPCVTSASQFVELPRLPQAGAGGGSGGIQEGEGGGIQHAWVDSSEGKVTCVLFYDHPGGRGTMVGIWLLSEDDLLWRRFLDPAPDLSYDEVFNCDHRLPQEPVQGIGPVDPNRLTRIFFLVGSSSVAVDVRRTALVLDRARLVDMEPCHACESALLCPLHHAASTWTRRFKEAVQDVKQAGEIAVGWLQLSREHLHKVPAALQLIGSTFNLPLTTTLVTAAKAIDTANTLFGFGESASAWVSQNRRHAPPVWEQHAAVGTRHEATRAIDVWLEMGKPAGMKVRPATTVTPRQLEVLRKVFIDADAQDLIVGTGFDYVMVDPALSF